jgi:hypothetical protein
VIVTPRTLVGYLQPSSAWLTRNRKLAVRAPVSRENGAFPSAPDQLRSSESQIASGPQGLIPARSQPVDSTGLALTVRSWSGKYRFLTGISRPNGAAYRELCGDRPDTW